MNRTKNNFYLILSFLVVVITVSIFNFGLNSNAADTLWGCSAIEDSNSVDFGCPANADVISGPWILDGVRENHSRWLNLFSEPVNSNKSPYIYSYVIAGMARRDWNLQDCNVDPSINLCVKGATYLQLNEEIIIDKYEEIGRDIRNIYGDKPLFIHVEPDYFQYNSDSQEWVLERTDAWRIMNRITSTLKSQLPNAELVLDISPWNYSLSQWCSGFENINYGGLVGKWFDASENPDGQSYKQLKDRCGYDLVVNTAYGVGGSFNGYNPSWEDNQPPSVYALIQSPVERDRYQNFIYSTKADETEIVNVEEESPSANSDNSSSESTSQSNQVIYPVTRIINVDGVEYYSNESADSVLDSLKKVE